MSSVGSEKNLWLTTQRFHQYAQIFFFMTSALDSFTCITPHGTNGFASHPKGTAIMVKCLAWEHKSHDRDLNPHSADHKHQSLIPALLSAQPWHIMNYLNTFIPVYLPPEKVIGKPEAPPAKSLSIMSTPMGSRPPFGLVQSTVSRIRWPGRKKPQS